MDLQYLSQQFKNSWNILFLRLANLHFKLISFTISIFQVKNLRF